VFLDLRLDPLVGAAEESVSLLDLRMNEAVPPGPIRVLPKETDASRNEELEQTTSLSPTA
jgi:hypothetical protein